MKRADGSRRSATRNASLDLNSPSDTCSESLAQPRRPGLSRRGAALSRRQVRPGMGRAIDSPPPSSSTLTSSSIFIAPHRKGQSVPHWPVEHGGTAGHGATLYLRSRMWPRRRGHLQCVWLAFRREMLPLKFLSTPPQSQVRRHLRRSQPNQAAARLRADSLGPWLLKVAPGPWTTTDHPLKEIAKEGSPASPRGQRTRTRLLEVVQRTRTTTPSKGSNGAGATRASEMAMQSVAEAVPLGNFGNRVDVLLGRRFFKRP